MCQKTRIEPYGIKIKGHRWAKRTQRSEGFQTTHPIEKRNRWRDHNTGTEDCNT